MPCRGKRQIGLLAGFIAGIASVGCAIGSASPGLLQAPSTSEEVPQRGGLLHIPVRPSFEGKDPYSGPGGSQQGLKARPVYEPLVTMKFEPGKDYRLASEVVPWLAEKWELRNPTEYLFTLRDGVKWQDGQELTADDVVYTVKRVLDPDKNYRARADFVNIADVRAEGKRRVNILLKGADLDFLAERLVDHWILPKHVEETGQSLEKVAVGTGPFKMVTLDNQKGLTFERNPDYWMDGLPYLDGIVVHRGLDDSGAIAAMSTGQLDLYNPPPPAGRGLAQLVSVVPGVQFLEYSLNYAPTVFMRLDRPPFDDVRVRRALHLGLDRSRLIDLALEGKGFLASPGVQPETPQALPQAELETIPGMSRGTKQADTAEARRLLVEAGVLAGRKLEITYAPNLTSTAPLVEPLERLWHESLGVEVALKPLESGVFESRKRDGGYDLLIDTAGTPPLLTYRNAYHSSGLYARARGMRDSELDQLIETAQNEGDAKGRQQALRQIQRRIIDKVYGIPTVEAVAVAAWQPWVKGYLLNPGGQVIPYYTPPMTWLDTSLLPAARKAEKLPF